MTHWRSQTRAHEGDATGSRATLMRGEGRYRSSSSLPFHAHVAFSARGQPRPAPDCHGWLWILSERVRVLADAKERGGPRATLRVGAARKMAGDVPVVRLICSSGRRAEGSGDHRPDQTSLAGSGRAAIGFRANLKILVYASR